jgi:hypothetical protein
MKKKLDLNLSKINTNFLPKFSDDKEDDSLILFEKTLTETFKSKSRKHSLKLIEHNNNNNIKKSLTKKNFTKTLNKSNKKINNNNKKTFSSSNKKSKNNNNNLLLLQKEINFKPINDFLQNDNIFQITDAQTDIMHELDEIYQNKIKKIKDLNKKFNPELNKIKEYIENINDNNNINNIIYNSILKDKNDELNKIEKEFFYKKDYVFNIYNMRIKSIQNLFLNEISQNIINIQNNFLNQLNKKNN